MPALAQDGMCPLYYALMEHAGPEVVLALLHAYPRAASDADKVRRGAGVGSVPRECMCATMCIRYVHVCMRFFYQFDDACSTTHMRADIDYMPHPKRW